MNEVKCKECGAILEQGVKECPSCGYPIEDSTAFVEPTAKPKATSKVNIMSIISIALGVVIIIMGFAVMNKSASIDTYSAKHYDANYAAFGGDFYTEIYGATDMIVDELNDINGGVEVLSESMKIMVNSIFYPVGMLIIALGLGVIAVSCNHIIEKR